MTWKDVIGDGRERRLLDDEVAIMLDCWFDETGKWLNLAGNGPEGIDPKKFKVALFDELVEDWKDGYLAEAGYTLDDLCALSSRLARLTPEQWYEMLVDMLSPPTGQ